jgi:hypothetical protein
MVLRFVLAGVAAAALGPLAAPAVARSPVLDPLAPCYVAAQPDQRQPVPINAHGFTPYALIDVYVDDVLQQQPAGSAAPQADVNGDLVGGSVPAPYIPFGVHRFTLRLAEHTNANNTVSAGSYVAALTVEQRPAQASTRSRVRFRGRGFTAPGMVYAHYVFAGQSHKTVRIGATHGPCGLFTRRMRQFPFKHSPKVGVWTIQFDQQRRYDPDATVLVRLTITVHRTIKPKRR